LFLVVAQHFKQALRHPVNTVPGQVSNSEVIQFVRRWGGATAPLFFVDRPQ
jgi:hypothetical protein